MSKENNGQLLVRLDDTDARTRTPLRPVEASDRCALDSPKTEPQGG
ncbi:MAG: hypothetical protein L0H37_02605 [Nitrosospira sp.]|nr:hypothetical protein [Nitrosospira sp.]